MFFTSPDSMWGMVTLKKKGSNINIPWASRKRDFSFCSRREKPLLLMNLSGCISVLLWVLQEEDGKKELEVPEMFWGKCL